MKSQLKKQTGMLFFSQIALIILGIAIKYIQTDELGDIAYGEYALFVSVTSIALIIFRFGIFVSLQVLLANNSDSQRERSLIGTGIVLTTCIAILFSLAMHLFSGFINQLLNTEIGSSLAAASMLCIIFPFHNLIGAISTGTNRIKQGAWFNFLPKVVFLIALIIFIQQRELTVLSTICMNLLSTLLIVISILISFKPSFKNFKLNVKAILKKNRTFGIHYYFGSLFNQTTFRMDEIFLAYFHSTVLVGFYSLAILVCTPMVVMSQSLSKAMFKRFANEDKIPLKVFKYNTLWLLTCVLVLITLSYLLIDIQYNKYDFGSVIKYIPALSIAMFFQGFATPYSFLAAKSMGKEIRNVAWIEALINVIGNLILIKPYGILGAIYSSIAAKAFNIFILHYYYSKYLREQNSA